MSERNKEFIISKITTNKNETNELIFMSNINLSTDTFESKNEFEH